MGNLLKYSTQYSELFTQSIDTTKWTIQALDSEYDIVEAPNLTGEMAFKAELNYSSDYSLLVDFNGLPRSEIALKSNFLGFQSGREFIIKFKLFLPADFQVETSTTNGLSIFQIHQQSDGTPPPFNIILKDDMYSFWSYNYMSEVHNKIELGNYLSELIGKWTSWTIWYRANDLEKGFIKLYKDGKNLINWRYPNIFPDEYSYLKLGLYKWNWQIEPTSTDYHCAYYTDLDVQEYV